MTPYVCRFISKEDQEIFEIVRFAVQKLPDIDLGMDSNKGKILLSCHMLARAVGRRFGLKVIDGRFNKLYHHSWLVTRNGHIIDVYPVAIIGGPIMIDGGSYSPYLDLYKEQLPFVGFDPESFADSVDKIFELL